ncbi:hypothetical protein D3C73_1410370 [compost metagenome]
MIGLDCLQYRTLLIGGQQRGIRRITVASLLRQQLFTLLDDRVARRTLYLGNQPAFAVEAPAPGGICQGMADQAIEGVVVVMAEHGLAR